MNKLSNRNSGMKFEVWKREVIRLAKRDRMGYIVPAVNEMFAAWEDNKVAGDYLLDVIFQAATVVRKGTVARKGV